MIRFLAIFILLTTLNINVKAQTPEVIFSTFQKLNFTALSGYLSKEVDLCIINDQSFVSRAKATDKLIAFFSKHTIISIEPIHEGSSKTKSSSYNVAKVATKSGKNFKLFIYQEVVGGKNQIEEIRIENLND